VAKLLGEPFTVRELVILLPYARECSAAGQATDARLTSHLGTSFDDVTQIRWGTIRKFKGLEAPAVVLAGVGPSKGYPAICSTWGRRGRRVGSRRSNRERHRHEQERSAMVVLAD